MQHLASYTSLKVLTAHSWMNEAYGIAGELTEMEETLKNKEEKQTECVTEQEGAGSTYSYRLLQEMSIFGHFFM